MEKGTFELEMLPYFDWSPLKSRNHYGHLREGKREREPGSYSGQREDRGVTGILDFGL